MLNPDRINKGHLTAWQAIMARWWVAGLFPSDSLSEALRALLVVLIYGKGLRAGHPFPRPSILVFARAMKEGQFLKL